MGKIKKNPLAVKPGDVFIEKFAPVICSTPDKRWIITRHVIEKFEIYAKTRKEAMENVDDPYSVMIRKETCIQED